MHLPKLTIEKFEALLEAGNNAEILRKLQSMDPADVADLLEDIDHDKQEQVFSILDLELASEVLVEMEPGEVDDFVDLEIAYGSSTNWSYPTWPSHLDHICITNELFQDFEED